MSIHYLLYFERDDKMEHENKLGILGSVMFQDYRKQLDFR